MRLVGTKCSQERREAYQNSVEACRIRHLIVALGLDEREELIRGRIAKIGVQLEKVEGRDRIPTNLQ